MKNALTLLAALWLTCLSATLAENPPASSAITADAEGNITVSLAGLPKISMKKVEGGTFVMGAAQEQDGVADDDELPSHNVRLSSFAIGRYEVTQELWVAVMGSNPADPGEDPQTPVYNVSWKDAHTFIQKLNQHPAIRQNGHVFRLPTEAEWEYAARGGQQSKRYRYAGSNNIDEVAWYDKNSGNDVHPVGKKQPNELGLFDMTGNVFEWCSDWYASDYYSTSSAANPSSSAVFNPLGPQSGSSRIVRGGCWAFPPEKCRTTYRATSDPAADGLNILGLRLAMDLDE